MDEPATSLRWRWMLQGNMKVIVPGAAEKEAKPELYDVLADPFEEENLAADKADVVGTMTAALDAWWKP